MAADQMTDEEYTAKGMLLGLEYVSIHGRAGLFRKRVADGKYVGCALYNYYRADTMELVIENRSELDRPAKDQPSGESYERNS